MPTIPRSPRAFPTAASSPPLPASGTKTFSGYLGENFGVAKLPSYTYARGESGETQKQLTAFAGYKLMGVGQYSKNKSAALEFAEYYTNKENQVRRFKDRGFVPTNKEAREENDVQSDACATAIANQLKYSKTQKNVPSTLWLPMQGLGNAMITAATTGSEFRLETELAAYVKAIEKRRIKRTVGVKPQNKRSASANAKPAVCGAPFSLRSTKCKSRKKNVKTK